MAKPGSISDSVRHSKWRWTMILIFFTAVACRLVYFVQSGANPLLYMPILDEKYYIDFGRSVASGFLLGENRVFFMDPLYGYALGSIFFLFGENLTAIRLIQIILDSISVILIYLIGSKVHSRHAGALAALFYAIYKVAFYYTLLLLKTTGAVTLSLAFTLALIHAAEREDKSRWFWLGVFAAVLTYFRGNFFLMAPLGLLFYLFIQRPSIKTFAKNSVIFGAGLMVALSLGAARNYHVSGEIVFLNTQTGRLLYSSNNPENMTGKYSVPSFSRRNAENSETDFHREAERISGGSLSAKEVSGFWTKRTYAYLKENPGAIPVLLYNKLKGTIGNYEIPNNHSSYLAAHFSSLARFPFPTFAFAFALGVSGLAAGLACSRKVLWLFVPILTTLLTVLIFYTSSRFRMPMVPPLLIGSGIFFVVIYDWLKSAKYLRLSAMIAAALMLAYISLTASDPKSTGDEEYYLARAYWNINDLNNARAISLKSAKFFPMDARFHVILGMVALSENNLDEAKKRNEMALEIDPDIADAHHNLGLAYLAMGLKREAIESIQKAYSLNPRPKTLFALARVYEKTGDIPNAVAAYKKYLADSKPAAPRRRIANERLLALGSGAAK